MDPINPILIVFLGILVFSSGFFSGSEIALFSLSSHKIKAYQTAPNPRKRLVAKLVLQPRDLLVTIFMMNTLVNILLQNVTSGIFGQSASWTLKVGVPLILTLIFGEVIPKNIGIQNNVRLSYLVAPSIDFLQRLLAPIRRLTIAVTTPISKVLFFYLKKEESISKDELQHVLKKSEEHGIMHPDEMELVRGYLELQDKFVKEIMWPREDMQFFEIREPLTKLEYLFVEQMRTRIPVVESGIDDILGIIHARTYVLYREKILSGSDLIPFLYKPYYIPETTLARTLLKRFEERGEVLALAVDEYGSITGLITAEDLLETVIGKIEDQRGNKQLYTRSGSNEIIASGKLELSEFNEIFDVNLQSPNNMLTIGGWLTEHIGDIPRTGTNCKMNGFLFQVLSSNPNRVKTLYVRKLQEANGREGS